MNLRDKKGSISIFVLVALLFMAGFLIISVANNVNKSKTIKEQFNIISDIYAYTEGDEGAYDKAYTNLREKNKQTMTASSETSSIELTKTYADKINNLIIYGNSIQNGTPTPNNPVEVQSVGNITNNIFDKNNIDKKNWYLNNGVPTSSGLFRCFVVKCEPLTEYTFQRFNEMQNSPIGIAFFDEYPDLGSIPTNSKRYALDNITLTSTENSKYVVCEYFYINASIGNVEEDVINGIVLSKGSGLDKYEEYGKYKIPIKVRGKNLIDNSEANLNKYVYAAGVGWKASLNNENGCVSFVIKCKPNTTYTLSSKTFLRRRISEVENLNTNIIVKDRVTTSGGELPYTFTTSSDTNGLFICLQVGTNTSAAVTQEEIETACIQLEEGSVVTQYEIYQCKTVNIYLDEPLRKLGSSIDYIDFKTGKVFRNVGYTVLSGSNMTWSAYSDNQENVLGFYTSSLPSKSSLSRRYSVSNRFIRTETDIAPKGILGVNYETFYIIESYFKISVSKERVTDLATFKTWLDNNPTYIYFILPSQAEENISIPELSTYEDYTKIEVLTDIAPSKIETEYIGYTLD